LDHPVYQQFSKDIWVALAQRWGRRAHGLAWQLDNELCGPEGFPNESHSPSGNAGFRRYLKQRYGHTATLNARWGTAFWSQSYSDWGEVGTPRNARCTHGHVIDYARYVSASTAAYTERCLRAMRPHTDVAQRTAGDLNIAEIPRHRTPATRLQAEGSETPAIIARAVGMFTGAVHQSPADEHATCWTDQPDGVTRTVEHAVRHDEIAPVCACHAIIAGVHAAIGDGEVSSLVTVKRPPMHPVPAAFDDHIADAGVISALVEHGIIR